MFEGYIPAELYKTIQENVPIPTVDGIIIKDEEILLMKRVNEPAKGLFWSPGGRIRKYETIEDSLKRNVLDETGLHVCSYKFINTIDQIFGLNHGVSSYFLVTVTDTDVKLNEEHSEYKWFSLDALPRLHPFLKGVIDLVKESLDG